LTQLCFGLLQPRLHIYLAERINHLLLRSSPVEPAKPEGQWPPNGRIPNSPPGQPTAQTNERRQPSSSQLARKPAGSGVRLPQFRRFTHGRGPGRWEGTGI